MRRPRPYRHLIAIQRAEHDRAGYFSGCRLAGPNQAAASITADATGDRFDSRACRWCLGLAQGITCDLVGAVAQLREVVAEADAAHDVLYRVNGLFIQALALAYHGDLSAARAEANAAIEAVADLGGVQEGLSYASLAVATLAAGDVAAADDALVAGWHHISVQPEMAATGALPWPRRRRRAGI